MAAKRKSISISNGPTGASKTYLTITEEIRQGHLTDINNKQVNVLLKLNRELVDYETKSNQNKAIRAILIKYRQDHRVTYDNNGIPEAFYKIFTLGSFDGYFEHVWKALKIFGWTYKHANSRRNAQYIMPEGYKYITNETNITDAIKLTKRLKKSSSLFIESTTFHNDMDTFRFVRKCLKERFETNV